LTRQLKMFTSAALPDRQLKIIRCMLWVVFSFHFHIPQNKLVACGAISCLQAPSCVMLFTFRTRFKLFFGIFGILILVIKKQSI